MSEYGKFNSAEELLKGYTELEKSYTQKCQQLSALQKQTRSVEASNLPDAHLAGSANAETPSPEQAVPSDGADGRGANGFVNNGGTSGVPDQLPSPSSTSDATQSVANDGQTVPSAQRADGAEQVCPSVAPQPPRVMTGGGNASPALPNRPRTLAEASELAKKYFE